LPGTSISTNDLPRAIIDEDLPVLRKNYRFNETTQGPTPEVFIAFFEPSILLAL